MRTLAIICTVIIMVSCEQQRLKLNNGLTRGAYKTTEVLLRIELDSNGMQLEDTMLVKEKHFNHLDMISKWTQLTYFDDATMEIKFTYNEFNKIEKESVYMSEDSFQFDLLYYYKDSIVELSTSEINREDYKFSQISNYNYGNNGILEKIITNSTTILPEIIDTIVEEKIEIYEKGKILTKKEYRNYSNPNENRYFIYKYANNDTISLKEFDYKDSLLSGVEYTYILDEYSNWIERKSNENESITFKIIRDINYKEK